LKVARENDLIASVINQALNKPSGFQVFGHVPQCSRRQAPALERARMQHVSVAARKMPPIVISSTPLSERNRQRGIYHRLQPSMLSR
jgi:hypothetical protein